MIIIYRKIKVVIGNETMINRGWFNLGASKFYYF